MKRTLFVLALLLTGCGPTIGLKTDFAKQGFEVGRTTRDEVMEKLGLPQKRKPCSSRTAAGFGRPASALLRSRRASDRRTRLSREHGASVPRT